MTWTDYTRASQGYWLRNGRFMEGIRRLAFYLVLVNGNPKKTRSLKEHKLFKVTTDLTALPVSIPQELKRVTAEELEAIKKRYHKTDG